MGDPKKHRKKYSAPSHPWQLARIEEERTLIKEYGFRNKTEIWRHVSFLRNATAQAKKLVTLSGAQVEKEKSLIIDRLKKYGLLPSDAGLDDILSISLRDVLERRLQTQVYKKNLANSVKQARQFITHGHIKVGGKKVTSPAYFVPLSESQDIEFIEKSSLANPEHPERAAARKADEKKAKEMLLVKEETVEEKPKEKPMAKPKAKSKKEKAPAKEAPAETAPAEKSE